MASHSAARSSARLAVAIGVCPWSISPPVAPGSRHLGRRRRRCRSRATSRPMPRANRSRSSGARSRSRRSIRRRSVSWTRSSTQSGSPVRASRYRSSPGRIDAIRAGSVRSGWGITPILYNAARAGCVTGHGSYFGTGLGHETVFEGRSTDQSVRQRGPEPNPEPRSAVHPWGGTGFGWTKIVTETPIHGKPEVRGAFAILSLWHLPIRVGEGGEGVGRLRGACYGDPPWASSDRSRY